jgi:hypothetical protein
MLADTWDSNVVGVASAMVSRPARAMNSFMMSRLREEERSLIA